jgi:hypothetical protein
MTNAVAIRPSAAIEVPADSMFQMAQAIASGKLFGSQDPNAVFTLMLLAQAEGKHPGLVMRDYHVINGKPAKKADAMLGDFIAQGGKVEWHALTDELADATFSHPQGGSVRISWDDARVKKAGLGGNPMHAKYPRQMKRSRVVSEGVRTVCPGATGGLYVPEEVMDFDDKPARQSYDVVSQPVPQEAPKRGSRAHKEAVAEARAVDVPEEELGAWKEWAKTRAASLDTLDGEALAAMQGSQDFISAMAILDDHAPAFSERLRQRVLDRLEALEAQS